MVIQLVLVALLYSLFIILVKLNSSKKYNEWDNATTTIADYTLKYDIPEAIYAKYRDEIFPTEEHKNVNYGFTCYMKREFEDVL